MSSALNLLGRRFKDTGDPPVSQSEVVISSRMSVHEIIQHLGKHGCQNITDRLDTTSCTKYPLSTGGFGDVYRGKLRDATHVAIKTMRLEIGAADDVQKSLKHAARELHIWSKCKHPNVLPLVGLVIFRNQIGMVSRWIEHGSLPSYIKQNPGLDRYKMSAQISAGLAYLHGDDMIHGDLKGLNVLVNDDGTPMLADFGNAVLQDCTLNFTATTRKNSLSPRWAAPELLDEREGTYSRAADVYALGMTVLETFTGQVPYSDKSDLRVITTVIVLKEPPTRPKAHIPSDSRDGDALWLLLKRCWANEPRARPKASEVAKIMDGFTMPSTIKKEGWLKSVKGAQRVQARPTWNFEAEKPKVLNTVAEGTQAANNLINAIKGVNREQESITTNPPVQECLMAAKTIRKQLVRYIQLVDDEEIIGMLIDANERIIVALELYDKLSEPLEQDSDDETMDKLAHVQREIGQSSVGPPPDLQDLIWGGESSPNLQAPLQPSKPAHTRVYMNSSDKETQNWNPNQYGAEGPSEPPSAQEEEDPFADPFADENEVATAGD